MGIRRSPSAMYAHYPELTLVDGCKLTVLAQEIQMIDSLQQQQQQQQQQQRQRQPQQQQQQKQQTTNNKQQHEIINHRT
eukprot:4661083-Amphidinium_carterae.1